MGSSLGIRKLPRWLGPAAATSCAAGVAWWCVREELRALRAEAETQRGRLEGEVRGLAAERDHLRKLHQRERHLRQKAEEVGRRAVAARESCDGASAKEPARCPEPVARYVPWSWFLVGGWGILLGLLLGYVLWDQREALDSLGAALRRSVEQAAERCVVCLDGTPGAAVVACGHLLCCPCAQENTRYFLDRGCPTCRGEVLNIVFFAEAETRSTR